MTWRRNSAAPAPRSSSMRPAAFTATCTPQRQALPRYTAKRSGSSIAARSAARWSHICAARRGRAGRTPSARRRYSPAKRTQEAARRFYKPKQTSPPFFTIGECCRTTTGTNGLAPPTTMSNSPCGPTRSAAPDAGKGERRGVGRSRVHVAEDLRPDGRRERLRSRHHRHPSGSRSRAPRATAEKDRRATPKSPLLILLDSY